ncbi:MAG: hypothetical protein GXO89_09135, partial [Chlorobi bacterium]|nr:hypothetical protein [Chlorobiota bacterium]
MRQVTKLFLFILTAPLIAFYGCSIVKDDYQGLDVNNTDTTLTFDKDGLVQFKLKKQNITYEYEDGNENQSIIIVDTTWVLLDIQNLTPIDINALDFWIIGYSSPNK